MGGIIEYAVKGVHFDSKIGYLDLKILYLKQKYMIYVVRYYWKCADGHFEIQYGHHANNPRWFIIARLDDPKNLYFGLKTMSINLTSLEFEIELNMYLHAVILKSKMAAIPHSKNGNISFHIPHTMRIKKMYSFQIQQRNSMIL